MPLVVATGNNFCLQFPKWELYGFPWRHCLFSFEGLVTLMRPSWVANRVTCMPEKAVLTERHSCQPVPGPCKMTYLVLFFQKRLSGICLKRLRGMKNQSESDSYE
jgi:hypothetical protein